MTTHQVKIFLTEESLVELEDNFVEKDENALQKFVYEQLRVLARTAKLSKMNKTLDANIINEDGQMKAEKFPFKDLDLDGIVPKENSSWTPKDMDKSDIKTFELKVGDKTWDYLKLYYQIFCTRLDLYNKSLGKSENKNAEKAIPPTCMEQLLHESLISPVMQKITSNIDSEFDKEFEEINNPKPKKEEKKKDEKTDENIPGSRGKKSTKA